MKKKPMIKVLQVLITLIFTATACASQTTPTVQETMQALQEIHVYTRDAESGTREAFEDKAGFAGALTDEAVETSGNGDMASKVGLDRQAIGYVSLTTDLAANNIKAVKHAGVEPTEANVIAGLYELARPFAYVTRAEGDFDSDEKEQLIAAFVSYITESEEGMQVVAAAGGIVDHSKARPWDEVKVDHPIVNDDNTALEVITAGSTSVIKTIEAALNAFVPEAGNFTFKLENTGSGAAYKRTLGEEKDAASRADIGFVSRVFSDSEDVADGMLTGVYCLDAVVVVVHKDNPIDNIGVEDLTAIFKGLITDWSDVQ